MVTPELLYLILLGPILAALIAILASRYFMRDSSAALRARLSEKRMRPLAFLIAFSPALSAPVVIACWASLSPIAHEFLPTAFVLSSFCSTALAACWLLLSSESARPLGPGRTTAFAFFLFFVNAGVISPALDFVGAVQRWMTASAT